MNKDEKGSIVEPRHVSKSYSFSGFSPRSLTRGISPVLVPSSHLSPPLTDLSEKRSLFLSHSREQFDYYVLLQWLKGTLHI